MRISIVKAAIIISLLAIGALGIIKYTKKAPTNTLYTIGILQTASHPALDTVRDSFIATLKNKLGDTIAFVVQNAQGSISQAHTIAQQFHVYTKYTSFFTIATPATQALSAVEKERPIVIAAVTDPAALGLLHQDTNITGVNDMIDVKAVVRMLTELVPTAKNIGLVYTAGEANSLALVDHMRKELIANNVTPIDFPITNESDVAVIVDVACRKTDLILAPTDNTVASTISLISSIARKHKKPLIVSDNMLVKFGALAAQGVSYAAAGEQAALITYDILINNKKPSQIPVEQTTQETIYINQQVLHELGLTIPATFNNVVLVD